MATITITRGSTLPDSAGKTDFHNLVDMATGSVSGILGSELSASAGIVGTQLDASAAIAATQLNLATVAQPITMTKKFATTPVALSDGATPALDASLGNVFTLAAAGNRTIAIPSNATNGQKIIIRHLASGGARTLALNTGAGGFRFGTDITALTETASGKTDYIGAIYSSIDSFWDVVGYVKGY